MRQAIEEGAYFVGANSEDTQSVTRGVVAHGRYSLRSAEGVYFGLDCHPCALGGRVRSRIRHRTETRGIPSLV